MGNVVSLQDKMEQSGRWLSGQAVCLHCGHEWVAVVPTGEIEGLDCSKCGLPKGVLKHLCDSQTGKKVWGCHCGCRLFRIEAANNEASPCTVYCANCGTSQQGS